VPTLRQRLREPHLYLAALVLGLSVVVLDVTRPPENQWAGRAFVKAVRLYQSVGRPILEGRVQCRYVPSCSEFSIGAVRSRGILLGGWMSARRVLSCKSSVPMGTQDPVSVENLGEVTASSGSEGQRLNAPAAVTIDLPREETSR